MSELEGRIGNRNIIRRANPTEIPTDLPQRDIRTNVDTRVNPRNFNVPGRNTGSSSLRSLAAAFGDLGGAFGRLDASIDADEEQAAREARAVEREFEREARAVARRRATEEKKEQKEDDKLSGTARALNLAYESLIDSTQAISTLENEEFASDDERNAFAVTLGHNLGFKALIRLQEAIAEHGDKPGFDIETYIQQEFENLRVDSDDDDSQVIMINAMKVFLDKSRVLAVEVDKAQKERVQEERDEAFRQETISAISSYVHQVVPRDKAIDGIWAVRQDQLKAATTADYDKKDFNEVYVDEVFNIAIQRGDPGLIAEILSRPDKISNTAPINLPGVRSKALRVQDALQTEIDKRVKISSEIDTAANIRSLNERADRGDWPDAQAIEDELRPLMSKSGFTPGFVNALVSKNEAALENRNKKSQFFQQVGNGSIPGIYKSRSGKIEQYTQKEQEDLYFDMLQTIENPLQQLAFMGRFAFPVPRAVEHSMTQSILSTDFDTFVAAKEMFDQFSAINPGVANSMLKYKEAYEKIRAFDSLQQAGLVDSQNFKNLWAEFDERTAKGSSALTGKNINKAIQEELDEIGVGEFNAFSLTSSVKKVAATLLGFGYAGSPEAAIKEATTMLAQDLVPFGGEGDEMVLRSDLLQGMNDPDIIEAALGIASARISGATQREMDPDDLVMKLDPNNRGKVIFVERDSGLNIMQMDWRELTHIFIRQQNINAISGAQRAAERVISPENFRGAGERGGIASPDNITNFGPVPREQ